VILNPDGHFEKGRYRADCNTVVRCWPGWAMAFSYDLFAWVNPCYSLKRKIIEVTGSIYPGSECYSHPGLLLAFKMLILHG